MNSARAARRSVTTARLPAPTGPHALPAWLRVVVLVAVTVAAYEPVRHAGFIWDDDRYIENNQALHSPAGLRRLWLGPLPTPQYYPLTHSTFWLQYQLWGASPLSYHVVNVLLHIGNALLLWRLLGRLGVPGAYWAAVVFALHPVHVESVAWVSERKNVLSGLFYLLSFLAFLRFWPPEEASPRPAGRWRFYGLALLLFLGALLSKTITCSLPAALLLVRWWKQGRLTRRDVLATAPLFVLGLALGLHSAYVEIHDVGAAGEDWNYSYPDMILIAGRALWSYAGKLAWPAGLTFLYPRWEVGAGSWWQYGFLLAALVVPIALYVLRGRLGRGPLTAVLFFGGTLVPALGFFHVYPMRFSFVADHFQYVASVGLLALAAAGAWQVLAHGPGCRPPVRWGLCGLLVATLGLLTWQRAEVYRDRMTLWTDTLAKNPDCWVAYSNRASLYQDRGQLALALRDYDCAIELRPDLGQVLLNRGCLYYQLGQPREAVRDFTRAIELLPEDARAYSNRAAAYHRLGLQAEAVRDYSRVIAMQPGLAEPYAHRGTIYLELGQPQQAVQDCTRAIQLQPDLAMAYGARGTAYQVLGSTELALGDLTRAIELRPDLAAAYNSRGIVHQRLGHPQEAVRDFTRAIRLRPRAPEVYFNRALAYHDLKQFGEAERDVERGRELGGTPDPSFLRKLAERSDRSGGG
jgi:tetratricopeptide (TPR) repeat protein